MLKSASSLGKVIREARKRKGLTQGMLAAMLGTTKGHVSQWETGKGRPGPSYMLMVGKALGLPLDWFEETDAAEEPPSLHEAPPQPFPMPPHLARALHQLEALWARAHGPGAEESVRMLWRGFQAMLDASAPLGEAEKPGQVVEPERKARRKVGRGG